MNGDYMFSNYTIKDDILYLEINFDYEFARFNKTKKHNLLEELKNYINEKKINKNFNKIIILCGGIIIGSIIFLKNDNKIDENNIKYIPSFKSEIVLKTPLDKVIDQNNENITKIDENTPKIEENTQNNVKIEQKRDVNSVDNTKNNYSTEPSVSKNEIISVKRSNGSTINIDIEDYIIGVIASEMPASFNEEALKAQAVVSRTYALKAKASGKILTDTVSTQSYINEDEMRNKWGTSFDTYYNKIKNAAMSTNGEYLTYNDNYIEALYHSTNNGKTESSLDVFGNYYPYLISVTSEYDKSASSYLRSVDIDFNTLSSKLGISFNNNSTVEILSYTDGGNIKEINIDGKTFTGRQLRELLGLRSADFDININENNANIVTRGYGHGVGMSQYGANGMANAGYSYKDILSHYYPKTTLKK